MEVEDAGDPEPTFLKLLPLYAPSVTALPPPPCSSHALCPPQGKSWGGDSGDIFLLGRFGNSVAKHEFPLSGQSYGRAAECLFGDRLGLLVYPQPGREKEAGQREPGFGLLSKKHA